MLIQNMFQDDINRKINGVIKVNQDDQDVIEQEVREYVITRELKKHFMAFFNYYCEMFDDPNADIGVWISGFFGSGKSHFIKMVSYILENRLIGDKTVVEMFRAKFADDPATFMLIDRATRVKAEPILFNIDIESSIDKDKKAVLRVFAKMFYNHLGFFGESLKVAQMEYYIDQVDKTEEFRRVFEEKRGMPWVQARKAFAFNRKYVVAALTQVLDMNEQDADAWCRDKSSVDMSTALLVDEIWNYVKRPIYWLFDSGKKNGFKCLIYMHRYQPDTLARIRTDYLHELQGRYRNAIETLERQIAGASTSERVKLQKRLTALKVQAEEARIYEEKIHHLADQMIKIDLDDGVKHNYTIFKDVLAPIK